MITFESYDRREKQILSKLAEYGIGSIEEAEQITKDAGLDVYHMIENIQPICFENVKWAYELGAAIAMKENAKNAAELLAQPDIDGGLIGGASLKPADFATIVKATAEE